MPRLRPFARLRVTLLTAALHLPLVATFGYAAPIVAQEAPAAAATPTGTGSTDKRPLTIADYARWRTIAGRTISPDGAWVAWSHSRVRGDDTLHVKATGSDVVHTVAHATDPLFSDDTRWVAYRTGVAFAEADRLERDRKPVPEGAGLMNLTTGETMSWDDVEAFGFSPTGSHFWIHRAQSDDDAEHSGTDLLLRRLSDGSVELLGSVAQAAFDRSGRWLAWTVDAAGRTGNGLYLMDMGSGVRRTLDHADARYARLTWADTSATLAVLRGDAPEGKVERDNTLVVAGALTRTEPRVVRVTTENGLAEGWVLSEKAAPSFSRTGAMLFVATRPQSDTLEDWPDDELPLADVNIWHWADDRIQSEQQRALGRDRNRTWRAALDLDVALGAGAATNPRLIPLEEGRLTLVHFSDDGRTAMARDDAKYISDWRPAFADWYRVDTRTGERTLVIEALEAGLALSPDGRSWLYWKDGQVHRHDVVRGTHTVLTERAPVSFVDREWDYFGDPPSWGVAGFTADGRSVVLNGEHDLWLQPLDGSPATNLTAGWGDANGVRLRHLELDPDVRTIDLRRPLLLTAFGTKTKQSGFARLERGRVTPLVLEDARFGRPLKADDVDRVVLTRESWTEFPDLHVTDLGFSSFTRLTDANPQQSEYLWGRRILFDYTLADGTELQGTLAIPEAWREGDRLPMVVRFYEQFSQDLHAHPVPMYRHQPNFAGYVSNGYLLMQPDIRFRTRTTHSDMLEAVEAATRKVIEMGYADPEAIGLSGHSFSGGGGAYIATRSTMFAAIAHGAAPINLVSEFNQLFVGSGTNNHSYDIHGQGRYGTNPYDDFELYWDQSPISGVESMDTPVLYLHGEEDSIVNWEQGLEWYNALRFLGKPIIWLSYPEEDHGLAKLENRIDFQLRLRQFFDHHLKGAPAPRWMTDGVSQVDKNRHLREFAPAQGTFPWGGASGATGAGAPAGAGPGSGAGG